MPRFFRIEKSTTRRTRIYLFGIKVFSYSRKVKRDYTIEEIAKIQLSYANIEKRLRAKARRGKKLKVAFIVSLSSMFPARPLLDHILKAKSFEPILVVVPDLRFDTEANLRKTIEDLAEYKDIMLVAPLREEDDRIKLKKVADIVFPSLPYNGVTHPKYDLPELIRQRLLPACVNYGYFRSIYDRERLISSTQYSLFWKVFVENEYNIGEYRNYQRINGSNAVLTGYCKMDALAPRLAAPRSNRKTILIAPHHSVAGGFNDALGLSNFQKYARLFLELPNMYPELDFIFRPHPALFPCLEREQFWGKAEVARYVAAMKGKPNVTYSERGDYFDDFAHSDGIIQDCGSYLVEYFYTKKPCCYMLRETADIDSKFTELGKLCLKNCYLAYEEKDIRDFMQRVIVSGEDALKDSREKFAEEGIMLNFPHAAETIAQYLEGCFYMQS